MLSDKAEGPSCSEAYYKVGDAVFQTLPAKNTCVENRQLSPNYYLLGDNV